MKKIILLLLAIMMCLAGVACNSLYDPNYYISEATPEATPEVNPEDFNYVPIKLDSVQEEFEQNEARAKNMYVGQYVSFYAYIERISETEIELCSAKPDDLLSYLSPASTAKVAHSSLKDKILPLNKGDLVVVKGKITELYGYSFLRVYIDMYIIEKA